jgi:hypothetical protein
MPRLAEHGGILLLPHVWVQKEPADSACPSRLSRYHVETPPKQSHRPPPMGTSGFPSTRNVAAPPLSHHSGARILEFPHRSPEHLHRITFFPSLVLGACHCLNPMRRTILIGLRVHHHQLRWAPSAGEPPPFLLLAGPALASQSSPRYRSTAALCRVVAGLVKPEPCRWEPPCVAPCHLVLTEADRRSHSLPAACGSPSHRRSSQPKHSRRRALQASPSRCRALRVYPIASENYLTSHRRLAVHAPMRPPYSSTCAGHHQSGRQPGVAMGHASSCTCRLQSSAAGCSFFVRAGCSWIRLIGL